MFDIYLDKQSRIILTYNTEQQENHSTKIKFSVTVYKENTKSNRGHLLLNQNSSN